MKAGIIGAMQVEVRMLIEAMEDRTEHIYANRTFHEGKIRGTDAVVVQCGIGKINAALAVQILKDIFNVTCIINTGVAGSLNNDIEIGDIVISKDAVQHDFQVGGLGYPPGQIPGIGTYSFEADEELVQKTERTIRSCLKDTGVFIGRIATGDQFISDRDKKNYIRDTFHADCCEMEGAGIAQAAYLNNLPFVIVRAISDKADESVEMSYDQFEAAAAEHCARLMISLAEALHE